MSAVGYNETKYVQINILLNSVKILYKRLNLQRFKVVIEQINAGLGHLSTKNYIIPVN